MSTLDELVRLWGRNENPNVLEHSVRTVLEFSLSANERQSTMVSMNSAPHARRIRLVGKDVSEGALVVRLLGNEVHPRVHVHTTKSLADLAESSPNQSKIADYKGVLDALTSHLQKVNSAWIPGLVQENTLRCLANLAQTQENHTKMALSSVLDPLVKLLGNDAPPKVHLQVARCLTNLAVSKANKGRIANYPDMLDALATLLHKHGGPGVLKQTTECLTNLASSQEVQLKMVSDYPVVLDALVRLLGYKFTTDVQRQSLKCLSNLSDHYQMNQVDIASHSGVLDALLRLVRCNWGTTDRIKIQFEAARCLHKLLLAPENLIRIASHLDTYETLVRCLTPSWPRILEVQNTAIECFWRLAAVSENQVKIVSFPGTVSALLNHFVQIENSDGQELAAWCLSKLAIASEAKVLLTRHPGLLKALVAQLNKSNSRLLKPTMRCLLRLSESEDVAVRQKIASQHGIINTLVRLLGNNFGVRLREYAVNCLSNLALTPHNAKRIVSHPNALISLVNLLQLGANTGVLEHTDKCAILEHTAKCLTNLACTEESQVKIASFPWMLNALELCLSVRNELSLQVQEQVVTCLAQLSASTANQSNIASYDSYPGVIPMADRDSTTVFSEDPTQIAQQFLPKLSPVAKRDWTTVFSRVSPELEPTGLQRRQSWDLESMSDPDDWFADPITCDIMCDPVKCNDGFTYDRWTIINNGLRKSPFDRSLSDFFIACDDIDVRRLLFRTFPQQETKFRAFRERYREKALQSAQASDFADAIEMLNNVLKWAPSDTECKNKLEAVLDLLSRQPPSLDSPNHNRRDGVLSHEDVIRVREREERRGALVGVIFVIALHYTVSFTSSYISREDRQI